ncbi:double-strand break repair helicase AddA [uncultured Rhodospira sp.]|uniref:double-strand break repair helicase AddA n=1 Tax=uncultured Rhodospira sp. TaxID=1936189 RepID=UPI0026378EC8|nr:double-strand break repair helicase AddA [uncultured Rhodospira sp.]
MTGPNPAPLDPVALAGREQRRAADPAASAWVAASAGSGKTKVLTDRVLNLLLDGTAPERLLCLTFTKAAAAEMANRVARRLAEWAVCDDPTLARALADLSGARPDPDRMAGARRLFARVLDTPGGLRIQTIHAFCQSVLRRFPLEAGLSPGFRVMDERQTAEASETALRTVLETARLGDPAVDPLAAALETVSACVSEDRFPKLMAAMKRAGPRLRRMFAARGGLNAVRTATWARLGVTEGETPEALTCGACADGAFDHAGLLNVAQVLAEKGGKKEKERLPGLLAFLSESAEQRPRLLDGHQALFLDKDGNPRSEKGLASTKAVRDSHPDIIEIMVTEQNRLLRLAEHRRAAAVAEASGALLTVADAYLKALSEQKDARALLDFDDLIHHTRALLERSDGAAWVLYKLDGGIDHLLIDEAQDTSPDQWAVARMLTEEFHAGLGREGPRGDTVPPTRTVFAVGDRKQSIYSFQGADPAGFEAMRGRVADRVRATGARFEDVGLHVSFRSTAAVLEAVNQVFVQADARDGVAVGAEDITHIPARVGQAGHVEVWPPIDPPEAPAPDPWKPPVERLRVESAPTRLARVLAQRIHRMIGGERLEARDRPIRAGDIMVLVRRRTPFVNDLSRALKGLGVPVAGADRMVLTDQLAVMDLMALGQAMLLPEDDLTLATVLKGPLIGLSEEQLFELAHGRAPGERLWHRLEARAGADDAFGAAWKHMHDLMAVADLIPPHELFARVLDTLDGRRNLVARLGPEADDPLDEFMALALAHDRDQPPSLGGFLRALSVAETEVKRDLEHGGQAVRVMTVHGSKGLQAPVVILPDTRGTPPAGDTHVYFDGDGDDALLLWPPRAADREPVTQALEDARRAAQDREYRRLLYVAMTRAEDRLIVCGWNTRKAAPDGCWHALVARGLQGFAVAEDDADLLACGMAAESATVLRHRSDQTRPPRPDDSAMDAAPADTEAPDWLTRPAPAEPRPSRPLAPSHVRADPPPVSPVARAERARFQRGILVHRLLQHLPGLAPERRAEAARAWLARPVHELDAATVETLADEVLAVLNHPDLAPVFGPGARAEVPIVGVIGDSVVSGQVDRLLVTDDRVVVVDFKTSRPVPADPTAIPDTYVRQMALYRGVLDQIYPDRAITCALVWTAGPGVMVLDTARPVA